MGKERPVPGKGCIAEEWDDPWATDSDAAHEDTSGAAAREPVLEEIQHADRFRVPAELAHGTAVRRRIQNMASDCAVAPEDIADLVLAVSEAFNNAVRHGASGSQDSITISLRIEDGIAAVTLRYRGQPFEAGVPSLPSPSSSGGRGRYIMSMLLDRIDYQFEGPWTAVRLVKRYRICPKLEVPGGAV